MKRNMNIEDHIELEPSDSEYLKRIASLEWKNNKLLDGILFALKIIGVMIFVIAVKILFFNSLKDSCNRYHYKPYAGQMFDSKTGRVIDVDSGKIEFEVK